MVKTNTRKVLQNGEIADADDINQIVENIGSEGGLIPYDPTSHARETLGNEHLGSVNYAWGDIFVNDDCFLREVDTTGPSISASVSFANLRKLAFMKDIFTTSPDSWAGHAGQFLRVKSDESGIEPAAPTNIQIFTASGTFNVPEGITKVYISQVGGGGGGGGGATGDIGTGGGGGGGEAMLMRPFTVTPSTGYTVTIGAAGTAGATSGTGGTGGTTSFDSLSCAGGSGGVGGSGGSDGNGGAGAGVGYNASASVSTAATAGGKSTMGGGNGGKGAPGAPGGGGGTPFGAGGNGSAAATANTGAGGGGGAGNAVGTAGGSGVVIVMY